MRIPHAENATVDIRKLRDYCLSQVGYALRTFSGVADGGYATGEHGGLPAVLCAGRVVLFNRGLTGYPIPPTWRAMSSLSSCH